jgi:hypothetical protein
MSDEVDQRWKLVRDSRAISKEWQVLPRDYEQEGSEDAIEVVPASSLTQLQSRISQLEAELEELHD